MADGKLHESGEDVEMVWGGGDKQLSRKRRPTMT